MLANGKRRDGVAEGITEVGILGAAAISCPPIGVHGELREIGQPAEVLFAPAAWLRGQSAKGIEVHRSRALRGQIRVQENFWLSSSSVLSEMYWSMSSSNCFTSSV